MLLSQLPYELITHISSFLSISDLVSLAVTCSHIHSCFKVRLGVHQQKLRNLSTISDINRYRTTSILRDLLRDDTICEDTDYVREAIIKSYQTHAPSDANRDRTDLLLPDGQPFDLAHALLELNLPCQFWTPRILARNEDAFEVFLILSLVRMPRLSRLRVSLPPCYGRTLLFGRTANYALGLLSPSIPFLEIFVEVVNQIGKSNVCGRLNGHPWPPGLESLRSLEIEVDQLHNYNRFSFDTTAHPLLQSSDLQPLFLLPNLRKLVLNKHPLAQPADSFHSSRLREWNIIDRKSPIEELILVGFAGCQEPVRLMIQSTKRLRHLILYQRGDEEQAKGAIKALQERHAESLETVVLPSHTSNALSWCQSFRHLKHLTISYVDVMAALRRQQSHNSISDKHSTESRIFDLATRLPRTIEFLRLIGGRQASTVTSVRAIPLYSDIQNFLETVILFVSTRGARSGSRKQGECSRHLRDICFGDMRVAVMPEDKMVGKTLHQSYTKAREIARLKLNNEVEKCERLKEVCRQSGVRLHTTNLKTRNCDHPDRHPYVAKRPLSRQELVEEAERLSQDADTTVQAILSQYVDAMPKRYRR